MEIGKIGIGNYIKDSMRLFGKYANTQRQLTGLLDGLKPSYRRTIYSYLVSHKDNNLIKSAEVVGTTIGKFHPHGDKSVAPIITELVKRGIFLGQGNFGATFLDGQKLGAAAVRYTEVQMNPTYLKMFNKVMKYVPKVRSEQGHLMPEYIPTPIPFALVTGSFGLGIGINTRQPMLDPVSLMEAKINDDPKLLKAPEGVTLNIEKSELDALWTTGKGRLFYEMKAYTGNNEGDFGIFIEGNPDVFTPRIPKSIRSEIKRGRLYIIDLSNKEGNKLFIGRNKGVRGINFNELIEEVKEGATYKRHFNLNVTNGESCYLIPMREWIGSCMDNYLSLLEDWKSDNLNKINWRIKIFNAFDKVVECLLEDTTRSDEFIAKRTDTPLEVVKDIMQKTISSLRRTDAAKELKKLTDKKSEVEAINLREEIIQDIRSL